MKTTTLFFLIGLAGVLAGIARAADPVFSDVAIRQNWPWSPKVNIDFTLTCDEGAKVDVTMRGFVRGTEVAMPTASFTGGRLSGLSSGRHRAVWDPVLAGHAAKGALPDFNVALSAVPSPTYMIVDLTKGPGEAGQISCRYDAAVWLDITNDTAYATTNLVLRRISAGSYQMGSLSGEVGRNATETPHTVVLTRDFYVGVYEVTQYQWYLIQSNWPSYFSNAAFRNTRPVEKTSWQNVRGSSNEARGWPSNATVDASSFIGKLRARTGLDGFDLPTEAQWEYACRAGTATALNNGLNLTNSVADENLDALCRNYHNGGSASSNRLDGTVVYYTPAASVGVTNGTAAVGSYPPNAWGLYDMHGNVYEWCLDWWNTPLPALTKTNPLGPLLPYVRASGEVVQRRVKRGGSWSTFGDAGGCRSAWRPNGVDYPYFGDWDSTEFNGFRIAFQLP